MTSNCPPRTNDAPTLQQYHTVVPVPDQPDETDPVLGVSKVSFFENDTYLLVVNPGEVARP